MVRFVIGIVEMGWSCIIIVFIIIVIVIVVII
jgi:hypothetical protein